MAEMYVPVIFPNGHINHGSAHRAVSPLFQDFVPIRINVHIGPLRMQCSRGPSPLGPGLLEFPLTALTDRLGFYEDS